MNSIAQSDLGYVPQKNTKELRLSSMPSTYCCCCCSPSSGSLSHLISRCCCFFALIRLPLDLSTISIVHCTAYRTLCLPPSLYLRRVFYLFGALCCVVNENKIRIRKRERERTKSAMSLEMFAFFCSAFVLKVFLTFVCVCVGLFCDIQQML